MPSFVRTLLFAGALGAVFLAGPVSQAADDPALIIQYRQGIMKAIGGHMGAIAMEVKGDVSFNDEIAGHAAAINFMAQNLARLFPAGSGSEAGKTGALNTIWEKPDEFAAAIKALQDESAKLVEVAETGDAAAIAQQTGALGNNGCGGCHKTFRAKQN